MGAESVDERLFWSARHGDVAGVSAALASGAAVDWPHPLDGRTPLAAAVAEDHLEAAEALLAAGANVEAAEAETGLSVLGLAVVLGSARCLNRLLKAGADLEARDADRWTPLMHAAARNQLYEAQQLLAAGADLEASIDGIRARDLAAVEAHDAILAFLDVEAGRRKRYIDIDRYTLQHAVKKRRWLRLSAFLA